MSRIASVPISRRALLATVPALASAGLPTVSRAQPAPPNFVVIVADDMRATDWQALPQTQARLGGAMFPNCFATTPLCTPNRATILTGQYTHHHGVLTNEGARGGYRAFHANGLAEQTIAYALHDAGYRTGLVGKVMNGYNGTAPMPGWDRWHANDQRDFDYTDFTLNENGTRREYPKPLRQRRRDRKDRDKRMTKAQRRRERKQQRRFERRARRRAERTYLTDIQARQAKRFIASTPNGMPLFLYLAVKAPHGPAKPAKRHRQAFRGARVERTPSWNEADVSDKPRYIQRRDKVNRKQVDAFERNRLRSLLAADEAIVAVVDELERTGRLDNTYIFILSDNGMQMGHHRWKSKATPYDQSVRVPLLAFGPGFGAGTDPRIVGSIDIAPTIAALAGVSLPRADGESLFTVNRDAILLELFESGDHDFQAVRTADHIYVEYASGERELYDYRTDPHELDNELADWQGHTPTADPDVVADLEQRLAELRE